MANTKFQLKRSVVPGKIPASGDLDIGELALNLSDAKIFSKHSLGNIITLSDYEMANSANIIARVSYSQANTATTIGQSAFATANSAASNTVLLQSVNNTQNTNITSAFTQANNAISNTVLLQTVDNTQNTNITAAFIKANVATTNAFSILNVNSTLLTSKSNSDTLLLQSNGAIVIDSDSVNNKITIGVRSATTSQNGVVQLYDSYDSTSITLSPTANALNFVYNLANTANSKQTSSSGLLTTNYKSQEFVASNNQTIFTVTDGYSVGYVSLYVNGVLLPQIEYTANNGSTIILTTPAGGGDDVVVNKWYFDRSIYLTSTLKVDEFVASNNQTSFITANTYTSGFVNVYRNGILLSKNEYVASGGTNVTLNSGASANDSISIQYWGSDQYNAAPVWIAANTALNVANGIAASANLALITANNAISNTILIQGVDTTQNTNISSAFAQANNAISNTVLLQTVDTTQNTNITAAFTQANNAISNTVLIQGVDNTQNTNINSAFGQANNAISNTVLIQSVDATQNTNISSAFAQANSATTIGQSAFTQANNAISNTVLIQGVDNTQNTNITAAFTQANNAISNTVLIQTVDATQNTNISSAFAQANNAISNTVLIQTVDATQNTNITAAFTQANNAISNTVLIQTVDATQNTNITSAFTQANNATTIGQSAFTQANNAISNTVLLQTVDATQNTNITAAFTQANSAYNTANTKFNTSGGNITGAVTISSNLTVTGNVIFSGNVTTISANNLLVKDNMIYLNSDGNTANPDLGFAGNYNDGIYHHAGFFRDASDGIWKVFDNYVPEPDASPYIDTSNNTFRIADFQANNSYFGKIYTTSNVLVANLNSELLNGQNASYYTGLISSAFTQANTATTIGQSAFTQANNAISNTVLIQGVDATQNTNISSAFTQANNAISNTVLIQTVDATQNTNITAAFIKANTANINAANASYLSTGTVSVSLLGSGTANANTYLRGDGSWAYVSISGGGGASVTISNTAPVAPTAGNLWWDSSDGEGTLRIYYTDIDSSQWVDASPNQSAVQNQIALTTAYASFDRANGAYAQANGAFEGKRSIRSSKCCTVSSKFRIRSGKFRIRSSKRSTSKNIKQRFCNNSGWNDITERYISFCWVFQVQLKHKQF